MLFIFLITESLLQRLEDTSSRLTYEMLHVPYDMFNEKAFNIYNDKFNYLKKLSNSNLTLESISDILIYLFDVEVIASENNKLIYSYKNFKSLINFIMVQKDLMEMKKNYKPFLNMMRVYLRVVLKKVNLQE